MTEKHSAASKKRWEGISSEEKTTRMRAVALKKYASMSKRDIDDMMKKVREAKKHNEGI